MADKDSDPEGYAIRHRAERRHYFIFWLASSIIGLVVLSGQGVGYQIGWVFGAAILFTFAYLVGA